MGIVADQFNIAWRDFNTDGVPSSGDYEVNKGTVRAIGPVIETSVASLVKPYMDAASASAQAAAAAAGNVGTLTTYPTALPYRVLSISGGIGTGVGGVPGTYALTVTGGPTGHKAYGIVGSDGKVAAYTNERSGLATTNTAPTYAWPAAAGFTTAPTAPTATVGTILSGEGFDSPSADSTLRLSWRNNAGALAQVLLPNGTQQSQPYKGYVDAFASSLSASISSLALVSQLITVLTQSLGPTLAAGSNLASNTFCFNNVTSTVNGKLTELSVYVSSLGDGSIEFDVISLTSTQFTASKKVTINISASNEGLTATTGVKTFSRSALESAAGGVITMAVGSAIGLYQKSGGAQLTTMTGTATMPYASGSPTVGTPVTFATNATNTALALKYTVDASYLSVPNSALSTSLVNTVNGLGALFNLSTTTYGAASLPSGTSIAATTAIFDSTGAQTVTTAGRLQGVSFNIASVGNGNIELLLATRSGATFTTYKKIILPLSSSNGGAVTGTATWSQSALEAAAGGAVYVSAGDVLGLYVISGGAAPTRATGSVIGYYRAGDPTVGTAYTYTSDTGTAGGALNFNFVVAAGTILPAALAGAVTTSSLDAAGQAGITGGAASTARNQRKTLLLDSLFTAAADANWTQTGAWTQAAGGWTSPASPTAYTTKIKTASLTYNARRKTIRWEFTPGAATMQALFGWETTTVQSECSAAVVDGTNNVLRLKKAMGTLASPIGANGDGYTSDPGDFTATAITALQTDGRSYALDMTVNERTNTYTLYDLKTGAVMATVQDATSGLNDSNFVTGAQFGQPVCKPLSGQLTLQRARIWAGYRKGAEFAVIGDSETDQQYLALAQGWRSTLSGLVGEAVVSCRPGEYSTILPSLWTSEFQYLLPKRILIFLGINGLQVDQASYNSFIASAQAQGIEVAVTIIPKVGSGQPTAGNTYLLGLDKSIPKLRFDLALSTGNDGVTQNTSYFQPDGTHFNATATAPLVVRAQLDWPGLGV